MSPGEKLPWVGKHWLSPPLPTQILPILEDQVSGLMLLAILRSPFSSQQDCTVPEAQHLHCPYSGIQPFLHPAHQLPSDGKDHITEGRQSAPSSPLLRTRLDLGFLPHSAP